MESLRALPPLRVAGARLIPIQAVRIERWHEVGTLGLHAVAEPRAIVVDRGGTLRAFDARGAELALEVLLHDVPGLAEAIEHGRREDG